ncbi:unnamed protein product [Rhizophagus irregularis]|nr:unnamed protein product [Rhizophagus irregularis]
MMNPAFTYSNVKEMAPAFVRITLILKGLIENEVKLGKSNINLSSYLSKTTLDMIGIVEKINDTELKHQIMTFLIAGHETTNVTTCWALHLLAQHPHEQDLLREELVKAFPDKSNFNPTYDEINSLEYLNCVTKETLRLNPPLPTITRTNLKDEVFGEYFIPKNTPIFIGVSALHKSTEIWGPTADNYSLSV